MPDRIASALFTSLPAESQTSSVFKVLRTMGHRSAAHIDNGYVLTAAHVVTGLNDADVLGDDARPKTLDDQRLVRAVVSEHELRRRASAQ